MTAILVIDDELSVADALEIILRDCGYEVTVALNGRDGVKHATENRFDVVITDLRLPDMSGLDVLGHVIGADPNTIVIIITAHSTPEVAADSIRRGALDVLPKPFYPSEVLDLITLGLSKRTPSSCS
ncbi:MAG TPA: response regulator [Blastocatellia bacterium]|jgi:DNA-binding NtrC family response regulator|nr:response regulator [Blastocatellia bacterium]